MKYGQKYREFFIDSDAGVHYLEFLNTRITQLHEAGEDNAERSRDFAQQAKGLREAIKHIQSATAGGKRTE